MLTLTETGATRTDGTRVETWDAVAGTYTLSESGTVLEQRALTAEEQAIADGWAELYAARQTSATVAAAIALADQYASAADSAAADAVARITTAGAHEQSMAVLQASLAARQTAVAATTPAVTIGYVTAIRDELAAVYGRLAELAGESSVSAAAHKEHYGYRRASALALATAYRMLAGAGRLLVRRGV